jgi:3'-phosphoadenosine 5'-phosphosulfate sulfotransferase (PAPS reductase)/FAD synthetase
MNMPDMNALSHGATIPDIASYDRVVLAFSGGKDSIACLLHLLDLGVQPEQIELHHHDIDGGGENFMDWPITTAYCRAIADHFGIRLFFSFREGGFLREMMRDQNRTAPVVWKGDDGQPRSAGGTVGPQGTRLRFPQVSADLSIRWCSPSLKIDVLAALIRNEPRFLGTRTLVITGERAQESPARAKYKVFEPHRTDNRGGSRRGRHVDHWRPVHSWSTARVWEIIERYKIIPHPSYVLGWGRLSCRQCIFGSANQWATIRAIYPAAFRKVADKEARLGVTIHRTMTVDQLADRGTPYASALARPALADMANGTVWYGQVTMEPWSMPAGAHGEMAGPC